MVLLYSKDLVPWWDGFEKLEIDIEEPNQPKILAEKLQTA